MFDDLEKKNILVTGGAGFMGSAFIRHLFALSAFQGRVINYDALTYCGNLANLQIIEKDSRYRFVHGNILDRKLIEKVLLEENISIVVHFAAETHVDRSIKDGTAFLQTNVLGTHNLLEAIREFPSIHFHHVSTDEVYGALSLEGVFLEDSPYRPNSPYSASKAASDHLVRAYSKTYGLSVTISHAGNNYGPYQFPEKLIPFMIKRLMEEETLPLYGRGDNIRDWLFVDDHARAIEMILRRGRRGEVYNIGAGEELTNLVLLKKLIALYAEASNRDFYEIEKKVVFIEDRLGHDFRYAMDTKKIREEIGWEPLWNLEKGLRYTMQWYLNSLQWLETLHV